MMSTIHQDLFTTTEVERPQFLGRCLARLTLDQYESMIASGVFGDGDRFELIEGMLVEKMARGRRHSISSEHARHAIEGILPDGWHLEVEKPMRLPVRQSLPEPDMFVARGRASDYRDQDPDPPDVAMVVEVSDSSVAADRVLASTYLGGGVPVYWLVNVRDRQLEIYAAGAPGPVIVAEAGSAELVLCGTAVGRIAVADLLP